MARPKGSLNKATKEVKEIASKHTEAVIKELLRIATNSVSDQARVSACKELLDRAHGKPAQAIIGDPEKPLSVLIATGVPRNS